MAEAPLPPVYPDILAPGTDFSNKVLHWQVQSYYYNTTPGGSAHSEKGISDIWVKFGQDGAPSAVRATTYSPDGSFLQASLTLPGQGVIIFDQPILGRADKTCREELPASAAEKDLQQARPFTIDLAKAAAIGFKPANLPPETPNDVTAPDVPASPQAVLRAEHLQWLTMERSGSKGTEYMKLEIDASSGLLIVRESELRTSDGTIVAHGEERISSIRVFVSDRVPAALFAESALPGGC